MPFPVLLMAIAVTALRSYGSRYKTRGRRRRTGNEEVKTITCGRGKWEIRTSAGVGDSAELQPGSAAATPVDPDLDRGGAAETAAAPASKDIPR